MIQYANRITKNDQLSEDVVQEVFEKLWLQREKTEFRQSPKSFLYTAVRNRAISEMRRTVNSKHSDLTEDSYSMPRIEQGGLDDRAQILRFINELSPRRMEVLVLSRFHDLTHKEISKVLGLSVRTIETHIVHGLRELRKKLQKASS